MKITAGKNKIHCLAALFVGVFLLMPMLHTTVFAQTREELEAELKNIEAQITEFNGSIAKTQSEKKTLANKISLLKKEQAKIQLQIKATNIEINKLDKEITATDSTINALSEKLSAAQEQTANILRAFNENDQRSTLAIFFEEAGFSSFLNEMESFQRLSESLAEKTEAIKGAKIELEAQKTGLETKQTAKKNLFSVQMLQQQDLQTKTGEQNKLLKDTQGKEAKYQAMLADSKKRALEIRSRIYELLGVGKQLTFGEAAEVAKWASQKTGVRAELLLAILTQETNLGKNVGTCNRPGDPPSKSWKVIMKPERDHAPFLAITKELNMNPDITPVSCPQGNGWGGAMGPSQFIPSTWTGYKARISEMTGKTPPNPWDPRDAFIATAIMLKNNGAAAGTRTAEFNAAMRYFSGANWTKSEEYYGNNVLSMAKGYEDDIQTMN
jgi:membrane-bound lytic murein transglycosylase B